MSSKEEEKSTTLSSILDSSNCFQCLSLPLTIHPPATIRKAFLKLSLLVHPDKNSDLSAKEAFQILSEAFETLYDEQSQRIHLQEVLEEHKKQAEEAKKSKAEETHFATASSASKKRRRNNKNEWRHRRQQKKSKDEPDYKRWEDVVADLKRREELEKSFLKSKSDQYLEKKIMRLVWKGMKVCRTLDERAGCPPTFVNGLWAPLYEQEAIRSKPRLPDGWEKVYHRRGEALDQFVIMYRNIQTGTEMEAHPDPVVDEMVQKAKKAEVTNKFRFTDEPRLFLGEIIEYLHDDHDYFDMDDDMQELEEEERARDNPTNNNKQEEYDF